MNEETMDAAEKDAFTQLIYAEIANTIANPKHPTGLSLMLHGAERDAVEDTLLVAATFLLERYARLLRIHFGSDEAALSYLNQVTALSTLKRIEFEGGEA